MQETCSLYGWPLSICHTTSLRAQFDRGIRFVDLRLSLPDGPHGSLKAYHGLQPEFTDFPTMLEQVYAFLDDRPSETVIVSVKQEDGTEGFEEAVYAEVEKRAERWWLQPRMPTLDEARGKAVMFSRFGHRRHSASPVSELPVKGLTRTDGLHLPIWPNNRDSLWETSAAGVDVAVQDWYDIGSIARLPEKARLVVSSLERQSSEPSNWLLTFLSASSPWLAFPRICAQGFGYPRWGLGFEGVNDRVVRWLMEPMPTGEASRVRSAVVLCDFFEYPDDALVSLLIDCNFA